MIKPIYKGEVEISHPASSGTAYTIIAGLVQLMGEEKAFDYLKALHKNITQYTRSGQAQAPNVAKGEVANGISFIFGFDGWRHNKYQWCHSRPAKARVMKLAVSHSSKARATRPTLNAIMIGS